MGHRKLLGVFESLVIDLATIVLLRDNKFPNLETSEATYADFIKHVKRAYLHDLWSVTESRTREVAKEKGINPKGRNKKVLDLLTKSINITRSKVVGDNLKEAKSKLGGDFVEFPTILSAVLSECLGGKEATKWNKFFQILGRMRNSTHDNFVSSKSEILESEWYTQEFKKGESMQAYCKDLQKITSTIILFFSTIESST